MNRSQVDKLQILSAQNGSSRSKICSEGHLMLGRAEKLILDSNQEMTRRNIISREIDPVNVTVIPNESPLEKIYHSTTKTYK